MFLKKIVLVALLSGFTASVLAADAKEEVTKAAKALSDKGYSWKTTVEVPEGTRFRPGPTEGKTDKDGKTVLEMSFGDNKMQAAISGEKAAYTNQDGEWQAVEDAEQGRGAFMARTLRNYKTPAAQVQEILASIKELKKEGDAYSGELTEEGVKALLSFRGRGGNGPEIRDAKGSAKFWVKDGVLSKIQHKVSGQMSFNNNDIDLDRTTTTEIKEVGTTKVTIPEGAKSKIS